jgi:transcriptional regulator EpsA
MVESVRVRSHLDMLRWLQGDFQRYLPHDIMVAAWGGFQGDNCTIQYDIISAIAGVRTHNRTHDHFNPTLIGHFRRWQEQGRSPFVFSVTEADFLNNAAGMESTLGSDNYKVRSILVHGISDKRSKTDCLYLAFRANTCFTEPEQDVMAALLPTIDATLRQVDLLDKQANSGLAHTDAGHLRIQDSLSTREFEILRWVTIGKTNPEIGQILNISEFTVKNHMKRIFKKLGVSNRAQAVGKNNSLRFQA